VKLIELGARPGVLGAAALGRMDLLRDCFDGKGRLRELPRPQGEQLSERDAIGLALLVAYVNNQRAAVDFLIEKDGNWDVIGVNNGAALHRAAWEGDVEMLERLIARGADPRNRDNPFNSTPMSWAQHNRQQAAFDWLRAHTKVDLHDAVCFDLPEHIEARLAEDPASVNSQIDQWEIPMAAPLHWACWTQIEDVAGTHDLDPVRRQQIVQLLLNRGADPNILSGDGMTPLDIAYSAKAEGIIALLERYGAARAFG
jgi:ankyrin repeat protein